MDARYQTAKNIPDDLLWCSKCLRDLTGATTWLSDDIADGRHYCHACAPDDAIRLKDTI